MTLGVFSGDGYPPLSSCSVTPCLAHGQLQRPTRRLSLSTYELISLLMTDYRTIPSMRLPKPRMVCYGWEPSRVWHLSTAARSRRFHCKSQAVRCQVRSTHSWRGMMTACVRIVGVQLEKETKLYPHCCRRAGALMQGNSSRENHDTGELRQNHPFRGRSN